MNAILIVVVVGFYLGAMAELVTAGSRSTDRRRLALAALAVLFTLVAGRALLPVSALTSWGWVAATAVATAAAGPAILRGMQVPWVDPDASRRDLAGSAVWLLTLVALTVLLLRSLA